MCSYFWTCSRLQANKRNGSQTVVLVTVPEPPLPCLIQLAMLQACPDMLVGSDSGVPFLQQSSSENECSQDSPEAKVTHAARALQVCIAPLRGSKVVHRPVIHAHAQPSYHVHSRFNGHISAIKDLEGPTRAIWVGRSCSSATRLIAWLHCPAGPNPCLTQPNLSPSLRQTSCAYACQWSMTLCQVLARLLLLLLLGKCVQPPCPPSTLSAPHLLRQCACLVPCASTVL